DRRWAAAGRRRRAALEPPATRADPRSGPAGGVRPHHRARRGAGSDGDDHPSRPQCPRVRGMAAQGTRRGDGRRDRGDRHQRAPPADGGHRGQGADRPARAGIPRRRRFDHARRQHDGAQAGASPAGPRAADGDHQLPGGAQRARRRPRHPADRAGRQLRRDVRGLPRPPGARPDRQAALRRAAHVDHRGARRVPLPQVAGDDPHPARPHGERGAAHPAGRPHEVPPPRGPSARRPDRLRRGDRRRRHPSRRPPRDARARRRRPRRRGRSGRRAGACARRGGRERAL
ncbi:MAG: Glycerol-3-phosphate regulon repressor, DeoR family, partial [uncultured Solirubrobacteraceae bacterium]